MSDLTRRRFLSNASTLLALPMLGSLLYKRGVSSSRASGRRPASASPKRFVICTIPNGVNMKAWKVSSPGALGDLPTSLLPLSPYKDFLLPISGLSLPLADNHLFGSGDHSRSGSCFLTGVEILRTKGESKVRAGISVDQKIASFLQNQTRIPSMQLGCDSNDLTPSEEIVYTSLYYRNVSWANATTTSQKLINPKLVFQKMFFTGNGGAAELEDMQINRRSVLDAVLESLKSLQAELGKDDKETLDQYATQIRDLEKKLNAFPAVAGAKDLESRLAEEDFYFDNHKEHLRIMFDMIVLALQSDSTRIATFMMSDELSSRNYLKACGVGGSHHGLSHHRGSVNTLRELQKIDQFLVEQFAYFLERMSSTKDGQGTLLDNTLCMYGSAQADGNSHARYDLPIILAGGSEAFGIKGGRHLILESEDAKKGVPLSNLHLTVMQMMGMQETQFGDSTGPIPQLTSDGVL